VARGADYCFVCRLALGPAIASPPRAAARIADAVPSRSTIARPGGCSSPRLVERCVGPWHCESAARAGGRAEAVAPRPGRARLDGRSRQRGRRCSQRSTAAVTPMHDRVDADRQMTFAFVLGGGLRSWRTIGPTRPRVVGVAQSRRRQHSQRWPDEQDFRSGAEHQLDVGRSAVPHLVRWGRDRRRSFRRHPYVGIEHLAESVAAECGVLEPDFRNRYEEKPTYSSV
jgi:hypothetical protein